MVPRETSLFEGFGPCRFALRREPPLVELPLCHEERASRTLVRRHCAPSPGVYGMIDYEGALIYVGKSKSLRDRLLSYFSPGAAGSKGRRIIRRTRRLVWEAQPDELAALLRELELIRRWQPQYNVRGRSMRPRPAYLCLGRGPAAYAYLAAEPSAPDRALFGPVRSNRCFRGLVRLVNQVFQLRDCPERVPMGFADQRELFDRRRSVRCMRRELDTCLAPCAGACSQAEYAARVRAAGQFLAGEDLTILHRLEGDMQRAAAGRRFELAASLRDTLVGLRGLADHLRRLRDAQERYRFVYPLPASRGRETWYLIDAGRVAAAVPGANSRRSAQRCLRWLERVYGDPRPACPGDPRDDLEVLLLVAGWFRQHAAELRRTLSPDEARAVCLAWQTMPRGGEMRATSRRDVCSAGFSPSHSV